MACCNEHLLDFVWGRLHEDAVAPQKNDGDVGWDLRCVEDENFRRWYRAQGEEAPDDDFYIELTPGSRYTFNTGVAIELPEGYHGILKPRSGLAVKSGINVLAGVIDNSYRGEIKICLHNTGDKTVKICAGNKIAQMIIVKENEGRFRRVTALSDTKRGKSGFGSTGK